MPVQRNGKPVAARSRYLIQCTGNLVKKSSELTNLLSSVCSNFIPFLCECTDESVLACRRIVSTSNLPPKASHTFSMGFRSGERAGHTDVEYPRCLDNPEQRVLMTCCVVVHKNKFITDSTTEKRRDEEVELHQCIVGPS
ncbi:hypothetical protein TNCV_136741 [Trichonephila clavipes]|nr:hypothetical protein TNCV_136741 [Trichonephila clavipes]